MKAVNTRRLELIAINKDGENSRQNQIVTFTKQQTRYLQCKPPLLLVKSLLNGSNRPRNTRKQQCIYFVNDC